MKRKNLLLGFVCLLTVSCDGLLYELNHNKAEFIYYGDGVRGYYNMFIDSRGKIEFVNDTFKFNVETTITYQLLNQITQGYGSDAVSTFIKKDYVEGTWSKEYSQDIGENIYTLKVYHLNSSIDFESETGTTLYHHLGIHQEYDGCVKVINSMNGYSLSIFEKFLDGEKMVIEKKSSDTFTEEYQFVYNEANNNIFFINSVKTITVSSYNECKFLKDE